MRGMRSAAAALGAAIALGACGGGGGDRLSKADYIKEADAICKAASDKTDALTAPETEDDIAAYFEAAGKLEKDMLKDLRSLKGPSADEGTLAALYDDVEEAIDAILADPEAAMNLEEDPMAEVGERAEEYGFTECGS